VGIEERYLVYLLERTESLESVLAAYEVRFGRRITRQQVLEFIEELRQRRLLVEDSDFAEDRPPHVAEGPPPGPFSFSSRGAALNFVFDVLVLFFGWVLSPFWRGPILLLALMAGIVGLRDGGRMIAEFHSLVSSFHIVFYLLFLVVPKLFVLSAVQAILVGMACRRLGGRIRSFGIRLLGGFLPACRTELDPSLLLVNRRGRLAIVSVGFWFALACGSGCFVAWAIASPGSGIRHLWLILIVPCLIRLVIQCNVFYRFSSVYLILCEALGEPKLLDSARAEIRRWLAHRRAPPGLSESKRFRLRLYGLAYYAYRHLITILVLVGGGYWFTKKYDLTGALIVIVILFWWNRDFFRRRQGR
jgi:hypothetical protein